MGLEKIQFQYIVADPSPVYVAHGIGDLAGIIVQSESIDEMREKIKDAICGYIDTFPDCIKFVTREEWDETTKRGSNK